LILRMLFILLKQSDCLAQRKFSTIRKNFGRFWNDKRLLG